MIISSSGLRKPHTLFVRFWPTLVSVLVIILLAAVWDDQVIGQTPAAQALGPYAADFLLGTGGALNGTGAGTRSLAAGSTITTASTCFAGWCGTLTATQPVLLAAHQWYFTQVPGKVLPQSGSGYWYNTGGAYFLVEFGGVADVGGFNIGGCSIPEAPGVNAWYRVYVVGAPTSLWFWPDGVARGCGPCVFEGPNVETFSNCLRLGSSNSTATNPWQSNQQTANNWVQGGIDGGSWGSQIKPALDAVIRAAMTSPDLQALGITGAPPLNQPPQVRRIAIDAGHGPPGCPGTIGPTFGDLERNVVLIIMEQVRADFIARGHVVIPTRPAQCVAPESSSSLRARAQTAIDQGAEIFVSIHNNAAAGSTPHPFGGDPYDPAPHGTEAWYDPRWGDASTRSLALARLVVQEQLRLGLTPHGSGATGEPGIKLSSNKPPRDGGPFVVLTVATKDGRLPAIIDEVAYLTNTTGTCSDEKRLHNDPCAPIFRISAANAIENAIRRFFP